MDERVVPAATAAFDQQTIAVGFRTNDPADPVVARAVPVTAGQTVEQAIAAWRQNPAVAYAEPNFFLAAETIPNDPNFGNQYGQHNAGQSGGTADADMDAPEAWNVATGNLRTVAAVIDTGVDYTHQDLYRNIWLNQAEIPAAVRAVLTDTDGDGVITFWDLNDSQNIGAGRITDLTGNGYIDGGDILKPAAQGGWADGVDAGGNGYLDDLIGWDFVGNDNNPMDPTSEGGGHGTHVAGTIGAVGNNGVGVAGVSWKVQLMPVRFLGANGGTSSAAAASIRYSAANGAVVSNNSWGGGGFSQSIYDAVNYARGRGAIFVAAAGNDGANNDTTAFYPSNIALDNVVAVAASDANDRLASFSNYGRTTVDLAAAGVYVASTYPGNQYAYMSGTSMATPQVTGTFALLLGHTPAITYSQAISRVLSTVDPVAALSTLTVTGGRVNAYRALSAGADVTGAAVTAATPNATGSSPVSAVRVTFSEVIAAGTFAAADVTVTAPGGAAVAVTGVTPVGTAGTQFDIAFAAQSAAGTYTVAVGPDVRDAANNPMDQNRNGVNGEVPGDRFSTTFTITSPPVSPPPVSPPPVSPPPGALFADDFAAAAVNPAWRLVGGAWAQGGGVLAQASAAPGDPRKAVLAGVPAGAAAEVAARVRVDGWADGDFARAGVGLGTDAAGRGYNLVFHGRDRVQFLHDHAAWGASYALPWQAGRWYWFKLRQEADGTLRGKVWADGQAEPAGWAYTQAGWGYRAGWAGLNGGSSGAGWATASFDDVTAAGLTPNAAATAAFVAADTTTGGNWQGRYGADGYSLAQGPSSLPAYAQVGVSGNQNWTWAGTTADPRAVANPAGGRLAACWYSGSTFTVDVAAGSQRRRVGLYFLDWDTGGGRAQRVEVLDAATGAVLDSRDMSGFQNGLYLSWDVTGSVRFRLTRTAGPNAVLSGIFFGTPT